MRGPTGNSPHPCRGTSQVQGGHPLAQAHRHRGQERRVEDPKSNSSCAVAQVPSCRRKREPGGMQSLGSLHLTMPHRCQDTSVRHWGLGATLCTHHWEQRLWFLKPSRPMAVTNFNELICCLHSKLPFYHLKIKYFYIFLYKKELWI